jgi:uncharacterized membrane-anchored protein
MKTKLLFILTCTLFSAGLFAKGGTDSLSKALAKELKFYDSVETAMKYESGAISLPAANVKLNIPKGFKYLNAAQASFVVEKVWGNPPRTGILGMLLPENSSVMDDASYAFIITYDEMGFVKDGDADKINYDDLLKELQKDEVEENKSRVAQGFQEVHIVGWASKPFYDKTNKVLHWAKNIQFVGNDENTLNYEVRILGRKGVLSMNAVASLHNLDSVKKDIDKVLAIPSFSEGSMYKDFDSKTDNVAAWTIGGLVAGKLLLKAGLFATIGKFLLAAWKFILIGLVAVWGAIKKFFGRKDSSGANESSMG